MSVEQLKTSIVRLEERIINMQSDMRDMKILFENNNTEIKKILKEEYVHFKDFTPIRAIVQGIVYLVLSAVLLAIIGLVIQRVIDVPI